MAVSLSTLLTAEVHTVDAMQYHAIASKWYHILLVYLEYNKFKSHLILIIKVTGNKKQTV